jgi:hypothetical protein
LQKARSARFTIAAVGVPALVLTAAIDVGAFVYAGFLAATFGWSPQDSLFAVTAVATVATMVPVAGLLTVAGLTLATALTFLSLRPES